jgi:Carboxypeptidase regulatory-like domain
VAAGAKAQSIVTGAISGTVTDASGAIITAAKVTLTNESTQETQSVSTNDSGVYQFPLLKPGRYAVSVEQDGFRRVVQKTDVFLGQTTTVNVRLEIGETSQTVEITERAPLLQTEDGNITSNVDLRTLQNIPNPGGDLSYIAQISPGVTMNTSSGNGYGNFTAYGLPATANLFTINGNDYDDPFLNLNNSGASNLLLGSNEVQEVAVVSNGYTGQYGRQAGAQVDYTKSGGNSFHGNAVYYWNGSALNANDFFLNQAGQARPFENNNQWAASFGGPIKKDKAFFFLNTEGLRYTFGSSNEVFVPTQGFQNYVLGTSLPANNPASVPFYQQLFALYNNAPGAGMRRRWPIPADPTSARPFQAASASPPTASRYRTATANGS